MKSTSIAAICALAVAPVALASSLVVTKSGHSFWVEGSRTEGSRFYYQTSTNTVEQSAAADDIENVIPEAVRGRQYTPEAIDSALAGAKRSRKSHPRLGKQLIVLEQQWDSLKNPDASLEPQIAALAAGFDASGKDPDTYRDLCVQLDMLRFKDMRGAYTAQLAQATETMRDEFFRVQKAKLGGILSAPGSGVGNCMAGRTLAMSLKACSLADEQRRTLDESVAACIDATVTQQCTAATASFAGARTVDAYLTSMTALHELRLQMAESERAKAGIERFSGILRASALHVFTNYELTAKGYLIGETDNRILAGSAGTRGFSSSVPVGSMQLDEQCCMFPLKAPPPIAAGNAFELPMRLLFNRVQPRGRFYAIVAETRSGDGHIRPVLWRIQSFAVKSGRADVPFAAILPDWVSGGTGKGTGLSLFLAFRDDDTREGRWTAASLGCPILPP